MRWWWRFFSSLCIACVGWDTTEGRSSLGPRCPLDRSASMQNEVFVGGGGLVVVDIVRPFGNWVCIEETNCLVGGLPGDELTCGWREIKWWDCGWSDGVVAGWCENCVGWVCGANSVGLPGVGDGLVGGVFGADWGVADSKHWWLAFGDIVSSERGDMDEVGVSGDSVVLIESLICGISKRLPSADTEWLRSRSDGEECVEGVSVCWGQMWPILTLPWLINCVIVSNWWF